MAQREHATSAEDILRRRTNLRFNGEANEAVVSEVEELLKSMSC